MVLALSILCGVAISAIVFALIWIGSPDNAQRIARRLEANTPPAEARETSRATQLIRDEDFSTLPLLDSALGNWSRIDDLQMLLSQAGIETKPGQILLTTGVIAMAGYL